MIDAGRAFATTLKAGDVVALVGDLGAGKTHLTKGILAGLGYEENVTSPTFTLVNEYHGGKMSAFHFDFYRLEEENELLGIGWDDYLDRNGIIIAEWADRFPALMPSNTRWVNIQHAPDGREITFQS